MATGANQFFHERKTSLVEIYEPRCLFVVKVMMSSGIGAKYNLFWGLERYVTSVVHRLGIYVSKMTIAKFQKVPIEQKRKDK